MTASENPSLPITPVNPAIETPTNPIVNAPTENSQVTAIEHTEKPTKKNPIILVLLAVLLLIIIAVGVYLFWYNSKDKATTPIDDISMPSSVPSISPTEAETSTKTYTGSTGFSFNYSDISWTLSEKDMVVEVPGLDGIQEYSQIKLKHNLENYELVINYKPKDSDSDMTLYGGAAGEFVLKGQVDFMGEDLSKYALVWEGEDTELYYNKWEEFTRGDTTFSIVLRPVNFEAVLNDGIIEQADLVLSNFKLSSTSTTTSTKTYSSPILENFSFQYPSSWTFAVREVDDLGLDNIKSNLVTLSKLDHTLTIDISPTAVFGGETYCYKDGDITFEYADNLVRVYKHKLFSDFSEKDFKYFPSENLDSKASNPTGFNTGLSFWTPGVDDDDEYVACGSLDFTTTEDSIYSYGDLNDDSQIGSGNPETKIKAIIQIEGEYTSAKIDPNILQEMDDIVTNILKN